MVCAPLQLVWSSSLTISGSLFSILWDSTGEHYTNFSHSAGLSIYSNGTLLFNQATLSPVNITLFNATTASATLASEPTYENILVNPNAPWGLPRITADYTFSSNGDIAPYEAWKMIDGLLWYDTTPDNRWTNNQSESPFTTLSITLPRPRQINSVSLAIYEDTNRGGVIACPQAIRIADGNGTVLAERNPWACIPNALNTVLFDAAAQDVQNATTPATGAWTQTDKLSITLTDALYYSIAIPEIQIWVPSNPGPRYEVEDGLLGTFIGGFEGRASGLNSTIVNGGVALGPGAWAELAGVKNEGGEAGLTNLTVVGGGSGTVEVQLNFLAKSTVSFAGDGNMTIEVEFLAGGNVVTLFWGEGSPWLDAIVVG
jgi:hypothetical protein